MPKPRLKQNRRLPKRWAEKHGAFYYLVPPAARQQWDGKAWFRLGSTLAEAHRAFAERMVSTSDTIYTMQDLLDRFQFKWMPTLAPATQKYYLYALPMLRKVFTTHPFPVADLEPHHAYAMAEHLSKTESPKKAKQASECLSSSLSYAVRLGILKSNPLIGQFKKPSTSGRNREVTDAELLAFAGALPRKWQLYVSLKLHTHGRRKGELLSLTHSTFTPSGILFQNNKRKTDQFLVKWTPPMRKITTEIMELHRDIPGDSLFRTRKGEPYIKPDGTTSGFDSIWGRYMRQAVSKGLCGHFTEHDLRAKAVEDRSLEVAQRLLRHTSSQVTQKHYRRKPEEI